MRIVHLFFILSLSLILLSACSTKKHSRSGLSSQDQSGEDEADRAGQSAEPVGRTYYSHIEMVVETTPEGKCDEALKITEGLEEKPKIELNDDNTLEFLYGRESFRLFGINVRVKLMGFDSAEYNFTALDGVVPKKLPFGIRFKRKPGNILEMTYLDQTFSMVLQNTPDYSYMADEKRGDCVLHHAINFFSDHTGYYPEKQL